MVMPPPEQQQLQVDDDDDFTFPTPPPLFGAGARDKHRHQSCSPPVWLHLSSYSPIRRSFSAADCAASPLRRCRSPALSNYCNGEEEEEEEERMDSLWEDLNDDDDMFSRRRSVGARSKEREVLGASRSSRGLVVMMRALKKMFVAHKGKSRVHKDEQQSTTTPSASLSVSPSPSASASKNR